LQEPGWDHGAQGSEGLVPEGRTKKGRKERWNERKDRRTEGLKEGRTDEIKDGKEDRR
jgi:hypothetical protein